MSLSTIIQRSYQGIRASYAKATSWAHETPWNYEIRTKRPLDECVEPVLERIDYHGKLDRLENLILETPHIPSRIRHLAHRAVVKAQESNAAQGISDIVSNSIYSIVIGSHIDLSNPSITPCVWLGSRAISFLGGGVMNPIYGSYLNFVYRVFNTTPESSPIKKFLTDWFVCATGMPPLYAAILGGGMLISDGSVDPDTLWQGMVELEKLAPILAPTNRWAMDKGREFFGLSTAAELSELANAPSETPDGPPPGD